MPCQTLESKIRRLGIDKYGQSRPTSKSRHRRCLLLIVRHFAEHAARFWCSLSFLSAVSAWRVGCIVLLPRCSEGRTTMTQMAAFEIVWRNPKPPQRRQRWEHINQDSGTAPLSGPGIGFRLRRVVLDHYVELGSSSRCSSRLVRPRRWRAVAFDLIHSHTKRTQNPC
jgi:hypothetical protein